jgi:hypothetical protein
MNYGNPAPMWAQQYPTLIHAWAWCRAARLLIRDFVTEITPYGR